MSDWNVTMPQFFGTVCRQPRRWNHGAHNNGSRPGHTASMRLVQTAASFRVSRNLNCRVDSACDGRSSGAVPLGTMAVHGEDADHAWHRRCPDRANASSSAADIPHSGRFRIKKNMEIVEVINFILDVSCLMVS